MITPPPPFTLGNSCSSNGTDLRAPLSVESDGLDNHAGPLQQPLGPRRTRVEVVRLAPVQADQQVVTRRIQKDLVDRVLRLLRNVNL